MHQNRFHATYSQSFSSFKIHIDCSGELETCGKVWGAIASCVLPHAQRASFAQPPSLRAPTTNTTVHPCTLLCTLAQATVARLCSFWTVSPFAGCRRSWGALVDKVGGKVEAWRWMPWTHLDIFPNAKPIAASPPACQIHHHPSIHPEITSQRYHFQETQRKLLP